jgi:hypothetical protein
MPSTVADSMICMKKRASLLIKGKLMKNSENGERESERKKNFLCIH